MGLDWHLMWKMDKKMPHTRTILYLYFFFRFPTFTVKRLLREWMAGDRWGSVFLLILRHRPMSLLFLLFLSLWLLGCKTIPFLLRELKTKTLFTSSQLELDCGVMKMMMMMNSWFYPGLQSAESRVLNLVWADLGKNNHLVSTATLHVVCSAVQE